MSAGTSDGRSKGIATIIVIAAVLLLTLGSCAKGAWEGHQRRERATSEGGGIVLIEAPKKTCWSLSALDERLSEGGPGGGAEDELSYSEREELEKAGGAFEKQGCGPAQVTLPPEFIYASVGVYVGDENDRHNYAAWLWLTRKLMPRGGAVSVDGDHKRAGTAVFAAAPTKVYSSEGEYARVISKVPFGPGSATALDVYAKRLLRKARLDSSAFETDRASAAAALMSSQPADSLEEARAALKRVAAPVAAALDTVFLAYLVFDSGALDEVWSGKPPVSALRALADMEAAGGSVAAQVPSIRTWLANAFLAEIRPHYDSSRAYFSAAKAVGALTPIDPAQERRWKSLATEWTATGHSTRAVEEAEAAREAAELDALLNTPSGSGWYPGCDGDGDGICYE